MKFPLWQFYGSEVLLSGESKVFETPPLFGRGAFLPSASTASVCKGAPIVPIIAVGGKGKGMQKAKGAKEKADWVIELDDCRGSSKDVRVR